HRVTLATIDAQSATEMGYPDRMIFHKRLAAQNVDTLPYLKLSELRKNGNRLVATLTHELTHATQEITTDQVVLETGTDPLAEVFFDLRDGATNKGISDVDAMANWSPQPQTATQGYALHRLGDAVTSRSIHAALLEAYRLAVHL
ncbi:MAG: N-methylproline demethylase, partial [Paracoccaceae bacterium]